MTVCYVGRKSCGCLVAAVVDLPGQEKETARDVAQFIREGYTVTRMESEEVRVQLHACTHKDLGRQMPLGEKA